MHIHRHIQTQIIPAYAHTHIHIQTQIIPAHGEVGLSFLSGTQAKILSSVKKNKIIIIIIIIITIIT